MCVAETAYEGFLPVDILIQVFGRLPLKSLACCKSTCKFWRRLISCHYFVQFYNEMSSKKPMILFESPKGASSLICADPSLSLSLLSLDFLNDRVKIRASCNGLLVCSSVPTRSLYYVCNPITGQFRALNRIPLGRTLSRFHPNDDPTLVGLAAEPTSGRFRVVLSGFHRPFGCRPNNPLVTHVFDSNRDSWTRFQTTSFDEFTHMNKNQVVFLNGCLHWLTRGSSHVLVLDLDHEVWSHILLPHEIADRMDAKNYLLELDGSLSVVQILEQSMVIWALKDYVEVQWIVEDKINLTCIEGLILNTFPISQQGNFVFLATHSLVLMYERKNKRWREIYSVGKNIGYPLWFGAYPFRSMIFPL